jgi:hypothetical protein
MPPIQIEASTAKDISVSLFYFVGVMIGLKDF